MVIPIPVPKPKIPKSGSPFNALSFLSGGGLPQNLNIDGSSKATANSSGVTGAFNVGSGSIAQNAAKSIEQFIPIILIGVLSLAALKIWKG